MLAAPVSGLSVPVAACDGMIWIVMTPAVESYMYALGNTTPLVGTLTLPAPSTVPVIDTSTFGWSPPASSLLSVAGAHCGSAG